jgi:cyclic dehypoxanthinyl futalosine synthase
MTTTANASALLDKGVLDAGLEDREAVKELAGLFDRNFLDLAVEADAIRKRLHPNDIVTYIVDRNINYTNVCWVACSFCAFGQSGKPARATGTYWPWTRSWARSRRPSTSAAPAS